MAGRAFRLSRFFCNQWSVQRWDQLLATKCMSKFWIMLTRHTSSPWRPPPPNFFFFFLKGYSNDVHNKTFWQIHHQNHTRFDIWVLRLPWFLSLGYHSWLVSYTIHHCTTFTTQSWGPKTLNLTSVCSGIDFEHTSLVLILGNGYLFKYIYTSWVLVLGPF
jgi:hypothetical protein